MEPLKQISAGYGLISRTRTVRSFILVLFLSIQNSSAQDFHLSKPDGSPLYFNPALTGLFQGHYRANVQYRTQWSAIANKPFVTTAVSSDMHYKKNISFGGQILNYRAGSSNYNVLSFLPSIAYDIALDSSQNHHLSGGLQAGFIHKSIDNAKLVFGNQYSNADGGGFDNTMPNEEVISNSSTFTPDINAGLFYYYANSNSIINPFLGVSSFHVTHPKETFLNASNRLPLRYVIHGGCKINITERLQVLPKFLVMRQLNDKEFTMSVLGYYYLKELESFIYFGPTYRTKDAAVFEIGLKYRSYTGGISYDINTSTLKPTTSGRGGFELSISYIAKNPKVLSISNYCPRL